MNLKVQPPQGGCPSKDKTTYQTNIKRKNEEKKV